MNRQAINLALFVFVTLIVHSVYVFWIFPSVSELQAIADSTGSSLPRSIPILLKDLEQEACLVLFLCSLIICVEKYFNISSHSYLFDVDLLDDVDLDTQRAGEYLDTFENLEPGIKNTALVETMMSALRRFALTNSIESAASSIEPALEALSLKNDSELTVLKYISWAIPSIGFLGTVRGIGQAMTEAEYAVAGDIGPMTSSLGLAFNSTFVALMISIVLMLFLASIQNEQDKQLLQIKAYTEKYLIRRIKHG